MIPSLTNGNYTEVFNYLNSQKNIKFLYQVTNEYFQSVLYFLRYESRFPAFENSQAEKILLRCFISKLRSKPNLRYDYGRILINFKFDYIQRLIDISPFNVLDCLFSLILKKDKKKKEVYSYLNEHPIIFAKLLLQNWNFVKNLSLFNIVTNITTLKILIKKINIDFTITQLKSALKNDVICEKMFNMMAETLILFTIKQNKFKDHISWIALKFRAMLPNIFFSLSSLPIIPKYLIPYITEVAIRYNPLIFNEMNDYDALVQCLVLYINKVPDKVLYIARLILSKPNSWETIAKNIHYLRPLEVQIGKLMISLDFNEQTECLLKYLTLQDIDSFLIINKLRAYIPNSFNFLFYCSKNGDISFQTVGVIAAENSYWKEFIKYSSSYHRKFGAIQNIIHEFINLKEIDKAITLEYDTVFNYNMSEEDKNYCLSFISSKMSNVKTFTFESKIKIIQILISLRCPSISNEILSNIRNYQIPVLNTIIFLLIKNPNDTNSIFLIYKLRYLIKKANEKRFIYGHFEKEDK